MVGSSESWLWECQDHNLLSWFEEKEKKLVGSSESWRWGCQERTLLQMMNWLIKEKGRCSNACEQQARLNHLLDDCSIALPHWLRRCKDCCHESLYEPHGRHGLNRWGHQSLEYCSETLMNTFWGYPSLLERYDLWSCDRDELQSWMDRGYTYRNEWCYTIFGMVVDY